MLFTKFRFVLKLIVAIHGAELKFLLFCLEINAKGYKYLSNRQAGKIQTTIAAINSVIFKILEPITFVFLQNILRTPFVVFNTFMILI